MCVCVFHSLAVHTSSAQSPRFSSKSVLSAVSVIHLRAVFAISALTSETLEERFVFSSYCERFRFRLYSQRKDSETAIVCIPKGVVSNSQRQQCSHLTHYTVRLVAP